MAGYDIVGDIHGHCDALERLLAELGYRRRGGVYGHPERHLVFVGDFVDRGPHQLETLHLVRSMIDAGNASAVMGNHEFNAIGYATPDGRGGHLRPRTEKNEGQHRAFLEAVGLDGPLHAETIAWFKTLPLWLETPGFRVVHACWHPPMQEIAAPLLTADRRFDEAHMHRFFERGTRAYEATEVLLKGIEIPMPEGVLCYDKEGNGWTHARTRWWDRDALTYRAAAIGHESLAGQLPDAPIPTELLMPEIGEKPVMIGHYWMSGEPHLVAPNVACLDFSVAKDGWLCAYSYDGEPVLDAARITSVPSRASTVPGPI